MLAPPLKCCNIVIVVHQVLKEYCNLYLSIHRTPITVVKKEKLVKFMCDLVSDQESKDRLMTEADYNVPNPVGEEISKLCPASEEQARAQILNEWNANELLTDSEGNEEERAHSVGTSNSDYGSPKQESSFLRACWGSLSDRDISNASETTLEAIVLCKASAKAWSHGGSSGNLTVYSDAREKVDEVYQDAWEGENSIFVSSKDMKSSVS